MTDDELKHYGVLGMKWGKRRNPAKAYEKAISKRNKLESKSSKLAVKAAKKQKRATKGLMTATKKRQMDKAYKSQFKANKLNLKSARLRKKALKWQKQMNKVFADYDTTKLPSDKIRYGKDYVDHLAKNNNGGQNSK